MLPARHELRADASRGGGKILTKRTSSPGPTRRCSKALNRHRGKGQQKVTVEHVHVHEGGQAIVGNVESRGVGSHRNQRNNLMHLDMHQAPRCRARTRRGSPCQSPAMPNGRCRMHGGTSPGAPKGNKNALKHGRYTAEAIARRRSICRTDPHSAAFGRMNTKNHKLGSNYVTQRALMAFR